MSNFIKYGRKKSFDDFLSLCILNPCDDFNLLEVGSIRGENQEISNGNSTMLFSYFSKLKNINFYSVDISIDAFNFAKGKLEENNLINYCNLINDDIFNYIKDINYKINALYVDGWDYHLGVEHHSEQETLKFIEKIYEKLSDNCIILFDDILDTNFNGKGKYAIPFLLLKGYDYRYYKETNQVLLIKKWNK